MCMPNGTWPKFISPMGGWGGGASADSVSGQQVDRTPIMEEGQDQKTIHLTEISADKLTWMEDFALVLT